MSHFENRKLAFNLDQLLSEFYPQLDVKLIFNNRNTVGNLFRYKDNIAPLLQSNVVYKYLCGQRSDSYIGETKRHLKSRVAQHKGISPRTGLPSKNPPNSKIYHHYAATGHDILSENFSILSSNEPYLIKISESLAIGKNSPSLNDKNSSIPLNIL